jgi:apolipoprotein N-acyltransferase
MKELLNKIPKRIMIAVSGLLLGATIVFAEIGIFAYLVLIPLALTLLKKMNGEGYRARSAYLDGFIFYMCYDIVAFHWLAYFYPLDFAGLDNFQSIIVVALAWIGLSLLQSVFSAFVFVALSKIAKTKLCRKYDLLIVPISAALFAINEWTQTFTWAGVPWGRLSIGQTRMPVMLKSASVFGSYFITFVVVAVNFFIAMFILMKRDEKRNVFLASATGLLAINVIIGGAAVLLEKKDGDAVRAAAIQVNSSSHDKWEIDHLDVIMDTLEEYSVAASEEGATLIVWPETVFPYHPLENVRINKFMTELASRLDATIVVGGFVDGGELDENSLIFVHPDGSVDETVYSKRHLVPFGEYVPMRKLVMTLIPPLAEISMLGEDLAPGDDSAVVDTAAGRLGALVCFDSIYEALALDSVRDGAEIIVLGTNDSWFLDSAAVYMHNAQAKLRAVETGRYVVRAANTGISSIITPDGEVLDEEPPLVGGYVIADIAQRSAPTVYSIIGNLFVYINIAAICVLSITAISAVSTVLKKKNRC